MADLAHLGIKINYSDVEKTTRALKDLHKTAQDVEKTVGKIRLPFGSTSQTVRRIQEDFEKLQKQMEEMYKLMGKIGQAQTVSSQIKQVSESIDNLGKKTEKTTNKLKEFWKRFGAPAIGFTVFYHVINLIDSAFASLNNTILEGIKLTGELAAAQAKQALWLQFATKGVISFSEGMAYSADIINALADASLKSTSTLKELVTGLDELGQSGVFISEEMIPQFTSLIDFTKVVAETTGSTTRQIRQELQALMQGEVRTTNILIRTAKHLDILTEKDIENLKKMQNRQEAIEKLSKAIAEKWERVRDVILSSDVNTAFEKWQKALERIFASATTAVSKNQGSTNIFAETIFKHFKNITSELKNLDAKQWESFVLGLNKGLDIFLSYTDKIILNLPKIFELIKPVITAIGTLAEGIGNLASQGFDVISNISKALSNLANTASAISSQSGSLVGEGVITALLFGVHKGKNITLFSIYNGLSLIEEALGKIGVQSSLLQTVIDAVQEGILIRLLFGKTQLSYFIIALNTVIKLFDYFSDKKELEISQKATSLAGSLSLEDLLKKQSKIKEEIGKLITQELNANIFDQAKYFEQQKDLKKQLEITEKAIELKKKEQKAVDEYNKKLEQMIKIQERLKKAAEENIKNEEILKFVEQVRAELDKLSPATEKIQKLMDKLDKTQDKLSNDEKRKYLANYVKEYFKLDTALEKIAEGLPKTAQGIVSFALELKKAEVIAKEFDKYKKELLNYAISLEQAVDPVKKFSVEFVKLQNAMKHIGLSNKAFAYGLAQISEGLVDVKSHEQEWIKLLEANADRLKKLPVDKSIEEIKKLAHAFDDNRNIWQKGIDKYIEYVGKASDKLQNIVTNAFKKLEDVLVDFITTGKLNFKSFVDSIKQELARLFVQQYITRPLAQSMYSIFGTPMGTYPAGMPNVAGGNMPMGFPSFGGLNLGFMNAVLPGTQVPLASVVQSPSASLAAAKAGTMTGGATLGSAFSAAGLGSLGYSTIGNWIGLPQNQYTGLTSGVGAGLGFWGGSALGASLATSGAMAGAMAGSVVPVVGTIAGAIAGGLLGSLFGNRRRDKSWFYLHTNIVPVTGVDYAVTSKLGTTYMPVKGRQNDIGFDTAKRKQFEQQLLTTIKQLDDTLTAQLTDEYLQAARQAVTGQQFSGVWRTDKKEKLKTILENLLYQRYATALAAIDGRILKFFDKNEEIGQALTNIGSVLGTFKDLNDTAKQFIFNISQSDLDKLKNYGYSYSQIFASFVNLTNQVPDFVEQIQNVMDKTGADLVSAFETLQSRVFYISTITANTLTNIDFSVDWNTFKSTIITNFKQQFVNQLYQVFINGISEQITSSLLLNYNTDLENLWSGFWNGSVSLNALYDAINIVNDILDKNLNKWNELKQILNQLGLETEKNIDLWATLNDNIINLYNEAKSNLISTYSPEKTFLYYRTQLFSNIEQLTNASVEKGSELVNTISSLLSSSITSGKSHFTSEYEYRKFIATIMARMNEAEIYRFKYGGTVEGPESGYTTFVEFHGKEHIVPDNNLEGIKKELSDIREILRYILSASGEQVKTSKKTYSIITKWDVNGVVTTSQ